MPKPKSSRVYILDNKIVYDFLWGDVGEDNSVYFGMTGTGSQNVENVIIKSTQENTFAESVFHPYIGPHKVSFHDSGWNVLQNIVEDGSKESRIALRGTPLSDISSPTRMMDIILPVQQLKPTEKARADINIELQADIASQTHISCTLYCMNNSEFTEFGKDCISIIRGASWESVNAFVSNENTWVFVLHDAVHDSIKRNYSLIKVYGSLE